MVYVLNKDGQPLMPTTRYGKVRRMLNTKQAKVVKRCPFTIQLLYETTDIVQPISLGIDAGSKTIGTSVTTETNELYASEVKLRTDVVKNLSSRREYRRSRRNRKTRYRKARFDNRKRNEGWIAPSIQNKIDTHLTVIDKITKILPVSEIHVEVASFDIQKIKNPDIEGVEYQQGEQLNSYNIREYVLFRDDHTCQCCKGKTKDKILNVHHIESRKTGGNAPNNLITLCKTCHDGYHKGMVQLPKTIKRGMSFRDATFMGIMRWAFYNKLKEIYPNVSLTYGYITKNNRIKYGLTKEHYNDAYCITGNFNAKPLDTFIYQKKVRCHNRQIHKANFLKGGRKKLNQASYLVHDFRLFDKVRYQDEDCFIFGRRSSGYFDIRKLDGTVIHRSASYKKLELLEARKNYLQEERSRQFFSPIN